MKLLRAVPVKGTSFEVKMERKRIMITELRAAVCSGSPIEIEGELAEIPALYLAGALEAGLLAFQDSMVLALPELARHLFAVEVADSLLRAELERGREPAPDLAEALQLKRAWVARERVGCDLKEARILIGKGRREYKDAPNVGPGIAARAVFAALRTNNLPANMQLPRPWEPERETAGAIVARSGLHFWREYQDVFGGAPSPVDPFARAVRTWP